jgi:hypothetical protein
MVHVEITHTNTHKHTLNTHGHTNKKHAHTKAHDGNARTVRCFRSSRTRRPCGAGATSACSLVDCRCVKTCGIVIAPTNKNEMINTRIYRLVKRQSCRMKERQRVTGYRWGTRRVPSDLTLRKNFQLGRWRKLMTNSNPDVEHQYVRQQRMMGYCG